MRRLTIALATGGLLLLLSSLAGPRLAAQDAPANKPRDKKRDVPQLQNANDCAQAQASARYVGYGYTHVVTLKNGCTQAVECALWTNVDETPRSTVRAAAGESVELVTRRGSPSRDVVAFKTCSFR
jgi:hypothetical protein